jgi:hypothetical protein
LRPGETFGIICSGDQLDKLERVIRHNGGKAEVLQEKGGDVYVTVVKA